jgi:hypothetical protein
LDGSWHTADFYSIYDSATGDGTINLEFNISNGLLEIRTFKYVMWFGCINSSSGKRELQQIFALEWKGSGIQYSLSDYVRNNGQFYINIKYNFTTITDGYSYINSYGRSNKLEIHFAMYCDEDPTPHVVMASTNNTSISTNTLSYNVTAYMKSNGLTKFDDFAVTFVMIGNNSRINVFNVSLWDKRAVIPMELDVIIEGTIPKPYLLERMSLIYGFNTSNMQKMNFSIYTFSSGIWQLLNNSKINIHQIYYNNWTITNFSYYYSSVLLIRFSFESGYNFSRAITNFSLNVYIKYYYRTGVQVSIWKTLYISGTVWEYRLGLRKTGTNDWYYTDWIMFGVMEPVPNFQGISESPYMTQWQLISEDVVPTPVSRFEDDLVSNYWTLTNPANKYMIISAYPSEDSWTNQEIPDYNYGTEPYLYVGKDTGGKYRYIYLEYPIGSYLLSSYAPSDLYAYWYSGYTSGSATIYVYETSNFNENIITWNNQPPAIGGSLSNFIVLEANNWYHGSLGIPKSYYVLKSDKVMSDMGGYHMSSSEHASQKPTITHNISKFYRTTGMMYMQTNSIETLEMTSPIYSTTQIYTGDSIEVDCQLTSSAMDIIFLKGGVIQRTIPLVRDNINYQRQILEVLLDVDISFDQIRISGLFSDTQYFKCFNIEIQGYVVYAGGVYTIYVEPNGRNQIRADIGNYTLKIYENNMLRTTESIDITNDLYTYTYKPIKYIECKLYLYSQSGSSLDLDAFHINITRTYFNITSSYWLQTDLFKVDENTFIHFKIYDIFYNLVKDTIKPAFYYIDIQIDVYELKISHKAQDSSSIIIQPVGSGYIITELLTPDELVLYELGINNYTITWTNGENGNTTIYNINLTQDELLILPSTYYQLYVSCFNFDGLGLDTDWVRLYINNLRKDFGFNLMKYDWTHFVILDFFNATLTDETIYTRAFTEYNIYVQVYNLILHNNYTHSIYITIERPNINITIKQIIPAQSSISYRFLPRVDYIISYYHVNGTKIGDVRITLDANNQIVSFGWYTEEQVPTVPTKEILALTGQMWLDIVVIISCFLTIISFTLYLLRKYIKKNKEQQKQIYNTNKTKTNLEVEGLLGKTHYFK